MRPVRRGRDAGAGASSCSCSCSVLLVLRRLGGRASAPRAAAPRRADGPSASSWRGRVRRRVPVRDADRARSTPRRPPEPTIDLAVIRGAGARRRPRASASLVVNPGGPGRAGGRLPRAASASTLPAAVRDRFDLVGVRPARRGRRAARSSASTASIRSSTSRSSRRPTPRATALVDAVTAWRSACAARNGDLLAHVSTADTVPRPRTAPRRAGRAIGCRSSGTRTARSSARSYADAYPDRVRAFVLDGPVDPTLSARRGDARPGARLRAARSTTSSPTAPSHRGLRVPPRR